ncbi:methyltransferase [Streptomyces corchorusii]|uniref:Methyltransferase n=2 Tax=Streptomyces TaxID=1883 RepID=A0A101PVM3_STRCK|nr:methyltransferase [Streptomyces corchorusii]KUN18485.1 methyltransferase [Streptomyces corchorusii]
MTLTSETEVPAVPAAVRELRELFLAAAWPAAIRAAARLGVADALGDTPATAEQLARETGADPGALRRLLRALSQRGVFVMEPDGRFSHSETSRLLTDGGPRSLRHMALWATEPWTWEVWPRLEEAVRGGGDVFHALHGKDFFAYLHEDAPDSARVFDLAMTQASTLSARQLSAVLDLTGVDTLVDVAGGQGQTLATLLQDHPGPRGVLFDLPSVVAHADPRLTGDGPLATRCTLAAGDCRAGVPVEADLYLLKNVLEWDDDSTVTTLRNVAEHARPGARVVIVENLVDAGAEAGFTSAMDLLLLLNVGGKKHTRADLLSLVERAGLVVEEVRPVNAYLHMIVARADGR